MTMRDLAAAVGMEAASLYNHIKSKEEILREICFTLSGIYNDNMANVKAEDCPILEKVESLVSMHIKINYHSPAMASVMYDEWRHLSTPDREVFLRNRSDYENDFIHILESGIKEGVVRDIDPKIALFTILSSMRWLFHWYYQDRSFDYEQVKSTLSHMIFESILTADAALSISKIGSE